MVRASAKTTKRSLDIRKAPQYSRLMLRIQFIPALAGSVTSFTRTSYSQVQLHTAARTEYEMIGSTKLDTYTSLIHTSATNSIVSARHCTHIFFMQA